jgi:hypothetical protein
LSWEQTLCLQIYHFSQYASRAGGDAGPGGWTSADYGAIAMAFSNADYELAMKLTSDTQPGPVPRVNAHMRIPESFQQFFLTLFPPARFDQKFLLLGPFRNA